MAEKGKSRRVWVYGGGDGDRFLDLPPATPTTSAGASGGDVDPLSRPEPEVARALADIAEPQELAETSSAPVADEPEDQPGPATPPDAAQDALQQRARLAPLERLYPVRRRR